MPILAFNKRKRREPQTDKLAESWRGRIMKGFLPVPGGVPKCFLAPPGVILGATSVYKCDKGLFARGFCVLKCVHKCVQSVSARSSAAKAMEDRGAWRMAGGARTVRGGKTFFPRLGVIQGATCYKGLFAGIFCVF